MVYWNADAISSNIEVNFPENLIPVANRNEFEDDDKRCGSE